MLKRGLLILLVFTLFTSISLAQDNPSCLPANEGNVDKAAQEIKKSLSQVGLSNEQILQAIDNYQPSENVDPNWVRFKGDIKDEIMSISGKQGECIDYYSLRREDGIVEDCWEQDALCIEEKGRCIPFEDMGWDEDFLKMVLNLNSQNENTKYSAVTSLGYTGSEEAVPILIKVLENDDSESIRVRAITSLIILNQYSIGSEEAVPALIKAIETDDSEDVRSRAIFQVSLIAPEEAVPILIKVLENDDSEYVRSGAISELLLEVGSEDVSLVIPTIRRMLESKDRQIAIDALFHFFKEEGFPYINGERLSSLSTESIMKMIEKGPISIETTPYLELNSDEINLRSELARLTEMEDIYDFFSELWDRGYPIEAGWKHDDYDPQNFKYIDEEVNRREIFQVLPEDIQEEYRIFLINKYPDFGDEIAFYKAIPTRDILNDIILKHNLNFGKNKLEIRSMLGHIFYIEDKQNYFFTLLNYLDSKSIELEERYVLVDEFPLTLELPFSYINLVNMEFVNTFITLDINPSLERVDLNFGDIRIFPNLKTDPNLDAYSSVPDTFGIDYAVFYFPKLNIEEGKVWLGLNYQPRENFKGFSGITLTDKINAFENYKEAFNLEEEYEMLYREIIEEGLSVVVESISRTRQKDLNEEQIANVVLALREGSSRLNLWDTNDLSQLHEYLRNSEEEITPVDFFKKSLEISNYEILKALALSHEFLYQNRDNLDSFSLQIFEDNPEDNSGAWYHFFGTALLSYSSQGLVSSSAETSTDIRCIDLPGIYSSYFQVEEDIYSLSSSKGLMRLQQTLISLNGPRNKMPREITTLATIFGEEVSKFTDLSGEVFVDFKGAAFGRELFRLASEEDYEYENTKCKVNSKDIGYAIAGVGVNFDIDSRNSLVYIGFGKVTGAEPTDDELRSLIKSWTLRNTLLPFLEDEARRFFES